MYLMQCLWIYSIITPQFTGKYFSNFSNLWRNIMSTECLFILAAVLKLCWGMQHVFQRRPTWLVLAHLKMVLYVDLSHAIWKSSGKSQRSMALISLDITRIFIQSIYDFSGKHLCDGDCMNIVWYLCVEVKIQ